MNAQTSFTIYYYPGASCNPPGRVGLGMDKAYELLKVDSESNQGPSSVVLFTEMFYMQAGSQLSWITESGSVAIRCLMSRISIIHDTFLHVFIFMYFYSFQKYHFQLPSACDPHVSL